MARLASVIEHEKPLDLLGARVAMSVDLQSLRQSLADMQLALERDWQSEHVCTILDAILSRLRAEVPQQPKLFKYYDALPPIDCLPGPLSQVFMTVLLNAMESLRSTREVSIFTQRLDVDTVQIVIVDSGCGMTASQVNRLFEPDLSPTPPNRIRGLGMWLADNIVKHHQGRIEVTSEPGNGTRVCITLPIKRWPGGV